MRYAFLTIGILCILFSVSVSNNNASATQIINFSHEDLAQRADLILIGTVKSEGFDFRPFDEMLLIDTVKVQPEEWLKNNHDLDSGIEVRYYGKWAKMADDMRCRESGITSFQPEFKVGEKVLLFLAKEDTDMYMGEGYYSFGFQGKYNIDDEKNIAQNHVSEKDIDIDKIKEIISEQIIQIQKDISSDTLLIDRTTNSITDMFLEKYPDAEVFVNREKDDLSINYKKYFDSENQNDAKRTDILPFLLLKIQLDKNGLRDGQYMECLKDTESTVLERPGQIRESLENQSCLKTIPREQRK